MSHAVLEMKEIISKEKKQMEALAITEGKEVPEAVMKAIINLRKLNLDYAKGVRISLMPILGQEKKKEADLTKKKAEELEPGIEVIDNLIDNIKKYAFDPKVESFCEEINEDFERYEASYQDNNDGQEDGGGQVGRLIKESKEIQIKCDSLDREIVTLELEEQGLTDKLSGWHPIDSAKLLLEKREKEKVKYKKKTERDALQRQVEEKEEEQKQIIKNLEKNGKNRAAILEEMQQKQNELKEELTKKEQDRVGSLTFEADPEARTERTFNILRNYRELTSSILVMPKEERDKNLQTLLKTVSVYKELADPVFIEKARARIRERSENILKNQSETFNGLRGLVQKLGTGGLEAMVSGYQAIMGDESTFMLQILKSAKNLGISFLQPVTYSAALVDKIEQDAIAEIEKVTKAAQDNKGVINGMDDNIIDILTKDSSADGDGYLKDNEKQKFLEKFELFAKFSMDFNGNLMDIQQEAMTKAYTLSHGEKNSMFKPDSQGAAKFFDVDQLRKLVDAAVKDLGKEGEKSETMEKVRKAVQDQFGGKNLKRLLQVHSPYGASLGPLVSKMPKEAEAETKPGDTFHPKHAHVQSVYEQGWFRKGLMNSIVGDVLQTGESMAFFAGWKGLEKGAQWGLNLAGEAAKSRIVTGATGGLSRLAPYALKGAGRFVLPGIRLYFTVRMADDITQGIMEKYVTKGAETRTLKRIEEKGMRFLKRNEKGEITGVENPAAFDKVCREEFEVLRTQILMTEVSRRKGYFQGIGIDLGPYGVNGFWKRFAIGAEDPKGFGLPDVRKTMTETGALKEAWRAANKRLLMLGLDLFPFPEELK